MPSAQPILTEALAGLIERVTFFNEDSGFVVMKVKVKGHRDLVTVVGQAASANAGEWINAEGRWIRDRQYGLQFKSERLTCTPPTTKAGIEKYLASGMIKGIGPVYAKKLVEKFGEEIFDIIDRRSARLEIVEGIGPGRRKKIKEAWKDQKIIREIMVFLHSHGVSTSRAVRIYKTYGEGAIERVRDNPYVLARDIRGIGFKNADQIAQKIGIPVDSILRARAGLDHVLLEAMGKGHCALPEDSLIDQAGAMLLVETSLVQQALQEALTDGTVIRDRITGMELIFLPALKRAEDEIASRIKLLAGQAPSYPEIKVDLAIQWCQEKSGMELSSSQITAVRQGLTRRVLIITGGPGVGKTTIINTILKILLAKKVHCALCAPTGRAAKRLSESTGHEAKTIHRLLEVNPKTGGFMRRESKPLDYDLLVVDECSMVDVPLMHHLLRALPHDGHLILVGDVDQLPSVGPGAVLTHLIQSQVVSVVRLEEIFRQAAGSRIITNAHKINRGEMPELLNQDHSSDFFFIEREEPDRIATTLIEIVKQRIPSRFGVNATRDIQVLCPMNRGSLGVRELNFSLQNELNPVNDRQPAVEKFGWSFRVGDKVIQTENNYDKEVFNGDIGQILEIDPIEKKLMIRFDQRTVSYDFGELDEVSLAYAVTIHKAQGSEFPMVVIPVAMQHYLLLQRNLIYTGVTRGRKLVVLVGQKKALAMAVKNRKNDTRFSGLKERLTEG